MATSDQPIEYEMAGQDERTEEKIYGRENDGASVCVQLGQKLGQETHHEQERAKSERGDVSTEPDDLSVGLQSRPCTRWRIRVNDEGG